MIDILEFIILLLVVSRIYYNIKENNYKNKYQAFFQLPSPKYVPFLGNSYIFLKNNLLDGMKHIAKQYGTRCLVYIPDRTLITSNPEDIKIILNNNATLEKGDDYRFLHAILPLCLLVAPVNQWRKSRKILSKGFKQNILDSFLDTFYIKSCELSEVLRYKKYNKNNIFELFERYTLDIFCEATLGVKANVIYEENDFVKCVTRVQRIAIARTRNIIKRNDFLFSFTQDKKDIDYLVQIGNRYIQNIIDRKKNNILGEGMLGYGTLWVIKNLLNFNFFPERMFDDPNKLRILDILLDEKLNLGEKYIREEICLFAAAAADTTAYTMVYTCCLLGMNQNIQNKVRNEVIKIAGEEREIDKELLNQLKYLEMAINESMRLIPVIPLIERKNSCSITVPQGTNININILDVHRNPTIYSNPMKYDPDRFLPEEVAKRPQYTFIPFSGGPRNCIGMKYAMMVMKTTIANIVRNFNITTAHKSVNDLVFESSVVMNTVHPLDVNFIPRNAK